MMANTPVNPGEGIGDPFAYVMCAFNKSHVIQRYKLDTHLIKCAAQHRKSPTKQCPFDATHIVPEEVFEHHVRTCPQRNMLDRVKYNIDPSCDTVAISPVAVPEVVATEDWENDDFQAYNPREQAARQPNLIRKIQGAVPSARRAFRIEQRQAFRNNQN